VIACSVALFAVRVTRDVSTVDGTNGVSEDGIVFGVLEYLERDQIICVR
jgi:hypothetical protein